MRPPRQPLYLALQTYRRRRMMDAARLLPVLGVFLVMLPLFWMPGDATATGTAGIGLYLFMVWFGLIVGAFVLARRLASIAGDDAHPQGDGEGRDDAGGGEAG